MFCIGVLSPIVILVRTLVQIIRTVVETVCNWVTTVIRTIIEVARRICRRLPWPLNRLCNWVTDLVEVVETVVEWVCEEVLQRIVEWIEVLVEYIIYVLKWVCWVIDWITRFPALLLCLWGIEGRRFIGVCVKILADENGTPNISLADANAIMARAAEILRQCNIELVVCDTEIVRWPQFLTTTTCELNGMFRRFFSWFSSHTCGCCSQITVYFVEDIVGAVGCAYPGTDWITVDQGGDGPTVVQEIGHLVDLWAHSSDPDNVMTDQGGGTADQITEFQCCMFRTSRFASTRRPC